jgi:hypothetical protein
MHFLPYFRSIFVIFCWFLDLHRSVVFGETVRFYLNLHVFTIVKCGFLVKKESAAGSKKVFVIVVCAHTIKVDLNVDCDFIDRAYAQCVFRRLKTLKHQYVHSIHINVKKKRYASVFFNWWWWGVEWQFTPLGCNVYPPWL